MRIIQRLQKKNKLLDLCVVGLGNPGNKYDRTRHNAGYDFLDRILDIKSLSLENSKKIDAQYAEISIGGLSIGFVKPNEFINLSGKTMSLLKKI
jgi:PTH1 family peptidyl-tRNA hydrolase